MLKRYLLILFFSLILLIPLLLGMNMPMGMLSRHEKSPIISIETEPNLEIHEGYVSQKDETVLVKRGRRTIAKVHLGEPVMVVQAENEEKWGHYQFPSISQADDGTLIVTWYMGSDTQKDFGKPAEVKVTPMMSKDNGATWSPMDKSYKTRKRGYNVYMSNGAALEVITPASINMNSYHSFPSPVGRMRNRKYFFVNELPEELQGAYFSYKSPEGNKTKKVHAVINDPGLLRSAVGDDMSVVWWGNIKELSNHSLVAGVYPCYYQGNDGSVMPSSVTFYKSEDEGSTWQLSGKIPYREDGIADVRGEDGYAEPAFEIVKDSTFLCVIRTGSYSPMYKTISNDKGITWSNPEPFTSNGVKPQLMQLGNGIVVLASGRPGVQLRFSIDGNGKDWTEPIDMMPFMNVIGYDKHGTCGYTTLLNADENTFYIVYSDFRKPNINGEMRKAIMFRKIKVVRK